MVWDEMFFKVVVFAVITVAMAKSEECETNVENLLKSLIYPEEQTSIQVQALRRDIIKKLQEALLSQELEDELDDFKRSIGSLARTNNLPFKRNLEALARAGYIRTLPEEDEEDSSFKRSIANLAKNGQLPVQNEEKRGIESLARNGELHRKREIKELIDRLYDKRNIGSLARNYNFPSYGKRFIGSLARNGDLSRFNADKRSIASLAREGSRINGKRDNSLESLESEKRNIASIKAQYKPKFKRNASEEQNNNSARPKRQVDYYEDLNEEYPAPVYQNQNIYDYEEFIKSLTGAYPNTEKRFLGSVARSGWFRPSASSRFTNVAKRHIGSLARLGWLPSFRSVRRFNRSGRSSSDDECSSSREASADGETEDNSIPENPLSLEDKRFLLQPAVDRILLQKVLMQPKTQ